MHLYLTIVAHYDVRPGQMVYINDSTIFGVRKQPEVPLPRVASVALRFFTNIVDSMPNVVGTSTQDEDPEDVFALGYNSFFGGDLTLREHAPTPLRFTRHDGLPVYKDATNPSGCKAYTHSYQDAVILIRRGECTFLQKLLMARDAGASGVLVVNSEDVGVNPTASEAELAGVGDLSDVVILVITSSSAQRIEAAMDRGQLRAMGPLMVKVEREEPSSTGPEEEDSGTKDEEDEKPRILYLNGHALTNTRLLV